MNKLYFLKENKYIRLKIDRPTMLFRASISINKYCWYDIDIKIYAFEAGMEFNQDIEIIKGKIIKDDEIKFENYQWECIEPNLGG